MNVLFLFGPNLSALGRRDPDLYGSQTLEEIMGSVARHGAEAGHEVSWRATEHEGELREWLLGAKQGGVHRIERSDPRDPRPGASDLPYGRPVHRAIAARGRGRPQ